MNEGERTCTKQIARIRWENLMNFGVLPLTFADESDYDASLPSRSVSGTPESASVSPCSSLTLEDRTRGTELIVRPRGVREAGECFAQRRDYRLVAGAPYRTGGIMVNGERLDEEKEFGLWRI